MNPSSSTPVTSSANAVPAGRPLVTPRVLTLVFIVALALAWGWLPPFTVTVLSNIGLYALVAVGLVLLTGVGGMTSFGQAAFVGMGAYATAWICTSPTAAGWLGGEQVSSAQCAQLLSELHVVQALMLLLRNDERSRLAPRAR